MTPTRHAYGPGPAQFLELTLPEGGEPAPVVVVLHGGFWRARYGIELARPLAADLAARGWAAVAVEYRRVGSGEGAGGGWPETLQDVAAAVDSLPDLPGARRLDLSDVTVVGHSAGGHLAAWTAGRGRLPAGAPGSDPRVRVTAAVLQAGVLDLVLADAQRLGDGATADFMGGGADAVPDRYAVADPVALLPTGVRTVCVHAPGDDLVPISQSEKYVAAAGSDAELVRFDGGHFEHLDPASQAGQAMRDALA